MTWQAHSSPWGGKRCACDGASQVVLGIAMAAWKMRTGEAQDSLDLNCGPALREQVSGDPEIYDAPIRLRKAFANVPSPHTALIDRDGLCGVVLGQALQWSSRWGTARPTVASIV